MSIRAKSLDVSLPAVDRRLVLGGVLAALSAALVLFVTQPPATVSVLVAGADLPAGVALSEIDVVTVESADPTGLVHGTSIGELGAWSLAVPLAEGEPLLASLLRPPEVAAAPNLLAMAVPLEHAVLGEINAGDYVDIYVTSTDPVTRIESTVLAAGGVYVVSASVAESSSDRGTVRILLAVDDELAPLLAAANRSGGVDLVKVLP